MALFIRHKKPAPLKPTANPYPSRFQRWRHSLGLSLILLVIVSGALRLYKPFYDVIQQGLFEGAVWIQASLIEPFHETHGFLKDTHSFVYFREEYAHLQKENEVLKGQLQALRPLQHENAAFRKYLNVPVFETYGQLTARILANPYDGLHHFFLIAAGSQEGIGTDQAVIVPDGVIGRLEKVGTHVGRVLLLNDARSRIPVMTLTSEQKAILAGDGSFMPTLVYIADVRKIQKGEQVVTSGLGGIFPPGLPIGIVDEVSNGKITVRPYVPFQKLEWVYVLKPHFEDFDKEMAAAVEEE